MLGKTQAEVKDKLRAVIEDSKKLDPVKAGSYTLEQWLKLWCSVYVEPQVRYSTKEFYHTERWTYYQRKTFLFGFLFLIKSLAYSVLPSILARGIVIPINSN